MQITTKKFLIGLLLPLLLLLVLTAGLIWGLAGSQGGTQWLAGRLAAVSGDALSWEKLEGTLLQSLQLRGLRLRLPGVALDVRSLELNWRPALLATGTLQLDTVTAQGVRLALSDGPPADTPAGSFSPADLAPPFDILLDSFVLQDIELRMGQGPPRHFDTVTLAAALQDDKLTLQQLQILAVEGELLVQGAVALTEAMPLSLDMQWDWQLPQLQLGGQLQAAGDASVLEIEYLGRGDIPLKLRGRLLTLLTQPGWDLAVSWPDFVLPAAQSPLALAPGEIQTEGNLDKYRVTSVGELVVAEAQRIAWSLAAEGDAAGLRLAPLELDSGPYGVALSGSVAWAGPIDVNLEYRARAEQLTTLNPQLPPRLDALGAVVARFEGETLTLDQLELALEQSPLRIDMTGSVLLPADSDPLVDGELRWTALQWPLAAQAVDVAVSSPEGRVQLAGTPDAWTVELAAQIAGSQVPAGQWQARGEGDRSELRLATLRGQLLDGSVLLTGTVSWDPLLRWNLEASGEELNPGQWQPDIPGQLSFDFRTRGTVDSRSGPQGTYSLGQLSGELLGRALSVTADGAFTADAIQLETLQLASGDNRFSASGQLGAKQLLLDWALQAEDPGALLPGATGSLAGSGRLQGSPASPRLQARLQGRELRFDQRYLPQLSAELQAGLAPDAPLLMNIDLGPLSQGDQTLLDSAQLTASGTTASHRFELDLRSPSAHLQGLFQGGLAVDQASWSGQITAVSVDLVKFGNWELDQAASLELGARRVALGDSCLRSSITQGGGPADATPTSVCAGAQWSPESGSRLELSLKSLGLARFMPGLSGEMNGALRAALTPAGALSGNAEFAISPGEMQVETSQGRQRLAHGGGQLALDIGAGGLDASLDFRPLQDGRIRAELTLPELNRLPLAPFQPLAGSITAELPDLSGLQGWVTDLESVSGRLDADFRLGGDLQRPAIEGRLALTEGAAAVPAAGLSLRDIELRLLTDPAQPDQMLLSGGLLSGKGRLELDGRLQPDGGRLFLTIQGEGVEVFDTRDARVLVSPDLALEWGDELLRLRGRVVVPRASITPQLNLLPGVASPQKNPDVAVAEAQAETAELIAPSPDVMVLGEDRLPVSSAGETLPFRLDSEVQLVLGEKVKVTAVGFSGRIVGAVMFRNRPGQSSLLPSADGRFSIEDGSFRAFGQDLDIETGQVIFRKVPVTAPEVNLRAVRWIDNDPLVSAAGVQVTGPLASPVLELFSRPQLDQTEIQSYLLTGRSASAEESVLSIGAYLHPKLYVGYGYNLLQETSEFDALYTITPRYGIEASVGEADNTVGATITYEH